jgi:hypothetical protein
MSDWLHVSVGEKGRLRVWKARFFWFWTLHNDGELIKRGRTFTAFGANNEGMRAAKRMANVERVGGSSWPILIAFFAFLVALSGPVVSVIGAVGENRNLVWVGQLVMLAGLVVMLGLGPEVKRNSKQGWANHPR